MRVIWCVRRGRLLGSRIVLRVSVSSAVSSDLEQHVLRTGPTPEAVGRSISSPATNSACDRIFHVFSGRLPTILLTLHAVDGGDGGHPIAADIDQHQVASVVCS